jgi:hypothetical protein
LPTVLLDGLKYVLIALVWLFFLFALRAVFRETKQEVRRAVPASLQAVPAREPQLFEPASRGRASKVVLSALEGPYAGQRFEVQTPAVLGRDRECHLALPEDGFVSSKHAELVREGRRLIVSDLGSRNGTLVNGDRIEGPIRVSKGDVIQVGTTALRITAT